MDVSPAIPAIPATSSKKPTEESPVDVQIRQPLTSNSNSSAVATILAKLSNPDVKLNRRERRALQRELEIAQGIQKPFTTSESAPEGQRTMTDATTVSSSSTKSYDELEAIKQKWPGKVSDSRKRPVSGSTDGSRETPPKIKKVQIPTMPVIRESVFKFDKESMILCDKASKPFECARMSYMSTSLPVNNFLKLCRFSPCGSYIATTSADNSARIFALNEDRKLFMVAKMPLGDPIYDANWLCSSGTGKQLIGTTAKHHPIHLWCEDGTRFASYRGINHLHDQQEIYEVNGTISRRAEPIACEWLTVLPHRTKAERISEDELSAAYSIAFSNDGTHLYGGYNAAIRIWDTERPGRQHTTIKTWEEQTGGQKSIVSCIAMNKSFDGVYAVATYSGSVGFYSDRSNSLECMFSTESTAITDMHYSHDGQRLFVAPRKDGEILCYDMRMPGTVMFKMLRSFTTNQRVCFDIESAGRYLFSGTSEGDLLVFDLNSNTIEKTPTFSKKVAECAVPCISICENTVPMIALCTGERVFPKPRISTPSSSDSESDDEILLYRRKHRDDELDNSLQLWAC